MRNNESTLPGLIINNSAIKTHLSPALLGWSYELYLVNHV